MDHANTIAISKILDKLNIRPVKVGKSKALYKSPISKESEPSFWVYEDNEWYDHGLSISALIAAKFCHRRFGREFATTMLANSGDGDI